MPTKIEWTDETWNPITGCELKSEGCRYCYAARLAATRMKNHPSRRGLARLNAAGDAKFTGEVRFNWQWLVRPPRWTAPWRPSTANLARWLGDMAKMSASL